MPTKQVTIILTDDEITILTDIATQKEMALNDYLQEACDSLVLAHIKIWIKDYKQKYINQFDDTDVYNAVKDAGLTPI